MGAASSSGKSLTPLGHVFSSDLHAMTLTVRLSCGGAFMLLLVRRSVRAASVLLAVLCAANVLVWADCQRVRIGATCKDGTHSSATGQGACSWHGGVAQWLYSNPTPPSIEAGPELLLTCGASVVLEPVVTGGARPCTYRWSPGGQTTETITVTTPGTYTLAVTGADGCSASDSVTVKQGGSGVTIDLGPDMTLTCETPEIAIDATARGGRAPYAYHWSPGDQTTKGITVTAPGTYTVQVTTADGCSAGNSVVVTESKQPPVVRLGPDVETACGMPVTLTASVDSGIRPYAFLWSPTGQSSGEVTVDVPGTYTVTVRGANGCSATASTTVTESKPAPHVDAGPDRVLTCVATSVLLDAAVTGGTPPYAYLWSPGGETTEDVTATAPGTYTVTVTGANGCAASDSVVVVEEKTAPNLDAGADKTLTCSASSATLTATATESLPPYVYMWSPGGQTTSSITSGSPGTYTVTVTGANGCATTDSVIVTESRGAPRVSAGPDVVLTCGTSSVLLDATAAGGVPPYAYLWSPSGQATEDITATAPGAYTLTVTGANGCVASDAVVVTSDHEAPQVEAGPTVRLQSDTPVTLHAAVTGGTPPYLYSWSPGGQTSEHVSVTAPGTYTVTVKGANGCSGSDSVTVEPRRSSLVLPAVLGGGVAVGIASFILWQRRRRT